MEDFELTNDFVDRATVVSSDAVSNLLDEDRELQAIVEHALDLLDGDCGLTDSPAAAADDDPGQHQNQIHPLSPDPTNMRPTAMQQQTASGNVDRCDELSDQLSSERRQSVNDDGAGYPGDFLAATDAQASDGQPNGDNLVRTENEFHTTEQTAAHFQYPLSAYSPRVADTWGQFNSSERRHTVAGVMPGLQYEDVVSFETEDHPMVDSYSRKELDGTSRNVAAILSSFHQSSYLSNPSHSSLDAQHRDYLENNNSWLRSADQPVDGVPDGIVDDKTPNFCVPSGWPVTENRKSVATVRKPAGRVGDVDAGFQVEASSDFANQRYDGRNFDDVDCWNVGRTPEEARLQWTLGQLYSQLQTQRDIDENMIPSYYDDDDAEPTEDRYDETPNYPPNPPDVGSCPRRAVDYSSSVVPYTRRSYSTVTAGHVETAYRQVSSTFRRPPLAASFTITAAEAAADAENYYNYNTGHHRHLLDCSGVPSDADIHPTPLRPCLTDSRGAQSRSSRWIPGLDRRPTGFRVPDALTRSAQFRERCYADGGDMLSDAVIGERAFDRLAGLSDGHPSVCFNNSSCARRPRPNTSQMVTQGNNAERERVEFGRDEWTAQMQQRNANRVRRLEYGDGSDDVESRISRPDKEGMPRQYTTWKKYPPDYDDFDDNYDDQPLPTRNYAFNSAAAGRTSTSHSAIQRFASRSYSASRPPVDGHTTANRSHNSVAAGAAGESHCRFTATDVKTEPRGSAADSCDGDGVGGIPGIVGADEYRDTCGEKHIYRSRGSRHQLMQQQESSRYLSKNFDDDDDVIVISSDDDDNDTITFPGRSPAAAQKSYSISPSSPRRRSSEVVSSVSACCPSASPRDLSPTPPPPPRTHPVSSTAAGGDFTAAAAGQLISEKSSTNAYRRGSDLGKLHEPAGASPAASSSTLLRGSAPPPANSSRGSSTKLGANRTSKLDPHTTASATRHSHEHETSEFINYDDNNDAEQVKLATNRRRSRSPPSVAGNSCSEFRQPAKRGRSRRNLGVQGNRSRVPAVAPKSRRGGLAQRQATRAGTLDKTESIERDGISWPNSFGDSTLLAQHQPPGVVGRFPDDAARRTHPSLKQLPKARRPAEKLDPAKLSLADDSENSVQDQEPRVAAAKADAHSYDGIDDDDVLYVGTSNENSTGEIARSPVQSSRRPNGNRPPGRAGVPGTGGTGGTPRTRVIAGKQFVCALKRLEDGVSCHRTFRCRSDLQIHLIMTHNSGTWKCMICQALLLTRAAVQGHTGGHSTFKRLPPGVDPEDAGFLCEFCGIPCCDQTALLGHLENVHSSRQPVARM